MVKKEISSISKDQTVISKEEAARQVHSMITRLAWLHYAFARTLMKELGEEKGKALSKKAVALYGELVGKGAQAKTKAKGLPLTRENYSEDLPSLGWAPFRVSHSKGRVFRSTLSPDNLRIEGR